MMEREEKTVHWMGKTRHYTALTIVCGLWPKEHYDYTESREQTTCENCKRTKGFLKE